MRRKRREFCYWRQTVGSVNIIIGAGGTKFDGWFSADLQTLDITLPHCWRQLFKPQSIDRILAEHVFEHLEESECTIALRECYRYLKPGGLLRIAVPDGYRKDSEYAAEVSPPQDGHKELFTIDTLVPSLETIGFQTTPLEHFDNVSVLNWNN